MGGSKHHACQAKPWSTTGGDIKCACVCVCVCACDGWVPVGVGASPGSMGGRARVCEQTRTREQACPGPRPAALAQMIHKIPHRSSPERVLGNSQGPQVSVSNSHNSTVPQMTQCLRARIDMPSCCEQDEAVGKPPRLQPRPSWGGQPHRIKRRHPHSWHRQ